jgi:pimeloyl-ACP methyl ester carboxylesterase
VSRSGRRSNTYLIIISFRSIFTRVLNLSTFPYSPVRRVQHYMKNITPTKVVMSLIPPIIHLPSPLTLTYKTLPHTALQADIYLRNFQESHSSPVLLFLHGGSWISGSRKDIPRATFHAFLTRSFTIVSIDYRLLPESSFDEQLADIQDAENWLRYMLPQILDHEYQRVVNGEKIAVLGVSAGGHLALLTVRFHSTPYD